TAAKRTSITLQKIQTIHNEKEITIHNFHFFFSSRRRHTRCLSDWSSDVCSSDLTDLRPVANERAILVGDLNVAPLEHDVWSHKQMLRVVSHTPVECEKLTVAQKAGQWFDAMRAFVPEPAKLYTWWSYRAIDWVAADRGRRLDHLWVS